MTRQQKLWSPHLIVYYISFVDASNTMGVHGASNSRDSGNSRNISNRRDASKSRDTISGRNVSSDGNASNSMNVNVTGNPLYSRDVSNRRGEASGTAGMPATAGSPATVQNQQQRKRLETPRTLATAGMRKLREAQEQAWDASKFCQLGPKLAYDRTCFWWKIIKIISFTFTFDTKVIYLLF
jgi:hypothetical protein